MADVGPDPVAPNVASTVTKDWEGSFLVGAIAARVTRTGVIGFVGGKDIPIIHRFFVGYFYGAEMARPDARVLEAYSGTFTDPAAGKEYALAQVNRHADIVFAVAGATSAGVIVEPNSIDLKPGTTEIGSPKLPAPPSLIQAKCCRRTHRPNCCAWTASPGGSAGWSR